MTIIVAPLIMWAMRLEEKTDETPEVTSVIRSTVLIEDTVGNQSIKSFSKSRRTCYQHCACKKVYPKEAFSVCQLCPLIQTHQIKNVGKSPPSAAQGPIL